ncbi:MAG: hypothetical protein ACRDCB_06545 [Clostridium sp.]
MQNKKKSIFKFLIISLIFIFSSTILQIPAYAIGFKSSSSYSSSSSSKSSKPSSNSRFNTSNKYNNNNSNSSSSNKSNSKFNTSDKYNNNGENKDKQNNNNNNNSSNNNSNNKTTTETPKNNGGSSYNNRGFSFFGIPFFGRSYSNGSGFHMSWILKIVIAIAVIAIIGALIYYFFF